VTNVGIGIRDQPLSEVSDDVSDTNIPVTASLAGETMESAFADGRDRIAQSTAKGVRGGVAGVMIQKEKTEAPHRWIRMAERRDLYGSDGHLRAKTRPAFLAEREPSVDEIIRDFEVSPHHRSQSELMVSRS
jgi:hypothetical protein